MTHTTARSPTATGVQIRANMWSAEGVRREWEPEGLVASWNLVEDDWRVLANNSGAQRLAFALLLKFFELEGRFPQHPGELPRQAVAYVGEQVRVGAAMFSDYDWSSRATRYYLGQIRTTLRFRECTAEDEARLVAWLADDVCRSELGEERRREAFLARCRAERLEAPATGRIAQLLRTAAAAADRRFCSETVARPPAGVTAKLDALADESLEKPG